MAGAVLDAKPAHVCRALAAHISEVEFFEPDETAKVLAMSVMSVRKRLLGDPVKSVVKRAEDTLNGID
jgi:hypothetical protein